MEKVFLNGIRAFKPNEKAPAFVIANLVVTKAELMAFISTQPETFKVNLKASQKGSYYLEVDSYVSKEKASFEAQAPAETSDLPF
jgi:hypothetical protein